MWHIPNAVDVKQFHRITNAKAALKLDQGAEVIFFLSSRGPRWQLNPNKGLTDLADAFITHVAPRNPKAILAVGGEWLAPNHPQVRGLGYVDRKSLPLWYSAASVYALPTKGDNFPYTVLEAMACETPVVANDIGGLREQVSPGVTGHLVSVGDTTALAKALDDLISNPTSRRAMGMAAREYVTKHFSLDAFARSHEALYQHLLQMRSQPQD
jgi:glycosyltransferase involved in cell wall biosynthesis